MMKFIKKFNLLWVLFLLPVSAMAQDSKKTDVVYIQTSAVCGECKERIETALLNVKGVKVAAMNMADKKVMVKYQPSKVQPEQLRQAIAAVGYDADDVKADPAAYAGLPACCKKDAPPHE